MNEQAKLRWRCRRGQLELDLLLQDYLTYRYPAADATQQARFAEWLELEDDALWVVMLNERAASRPV